MCETDSTLTLFPARRYTRAQIAKNLIVGSIAGCIFYGQGKLDSEVWDTSSNLPTAAGYNVVSILYFALLYAITGNLQAIPQIFGAKVLFERERSAGAYTTLPYFCSNVIVYLPLLFVTHVVFTNLTYWLVQLPTDLEIVLYVRARERSASAAQPTNSPFASLAGTCSSSRCS